MSARLDNALVARGLVPSRARARALIDAGAVSMNGATVRKASRGIAPSDTLSVSVDAMPYVSRAGLKLAYALEVLSLSPACSVALDLGASTGGFTQVLLEAGAAEVWAVDVGHGQLSPGLRADPRVHLLEGLNARDLTSDHVPPPAWITADLSFISLAKALPPALGLAAPGAILVALVKPQFEVGPAFVGKRGIVRDAGAHSQVRTSIRQFLERAGWSVLGETESPIRGGDGNTEFLIAARKPGR